MFSPLTRSVATLLVAASCFFPSPGRAAEMFPFVLPWDDAAPSVTNISSLLEKPAGSHGFVVAREGHLFAGDRRIRFFGVNMAFGGNFPTHADAEKVAARMAKFGINCVRFHHMDTGSAPAGLLQKDRKTLDPEALDRLDYFIAQLKQNGIYANLNLHVGNEYPGFQKWEGASGYFKGVDNFFPPFIEQQHAYARALLTHVNPYTKLAYTADPAVAFIEINNENGLMMEWNNGTLDTMPDPYAAEFGKQWNAWLTRRYGAQEKLAAAWKEGEQPLGEEMLQGGEWKLETHDGAQADSAVGQSNGTPKVPSIQVEVKRAGSQPWHVQMTRAGLTLAAQTYTASFRAKADRPRKMSISLGQSHEPWKVLATREVALTSEWQTFSLALNCSGSDERARLSVSGFGAETGKFEIENINLRSGGIVALAEGEQLGTLPFLRKAESARRTVAVQKDWNRFLLDTEGAYWPGLARFIKGELGAKSLVLGSATGFSPWVVQAQLDVVDAHAYWQHPHFPHRQWDMNDWTVSNESMAGAPDGGTLPGLALRRVAGKPFIVTEYNHASPNQYSAEAFLEVCAVAALQDWDGVFAFAYSHRLNEWDPKKFGSFFDIDQHPTKMATLPAALALFYRADLPPAAQAHTARVTMEEAIESIRTGGGSWVSAKNYGISPAEIFQRRVAMQLREKGEPAVGDEESKTTVPGLVWDTAGHRMLLQSARSVGVIGSVKAGEEIGTGEVKITPGITEHHWATITATVLEGSDFASARRILVTATGDAANSGMTWKNQEKTTVGQDWGKAPSVIEGIPAKLSFPASKLKAWALDERGQRREELPLWQEGGRTILETKPEQKTLWWELALE